MLNPTTGLVEVQPLPLMNGLRQLVLNLNGGDAVLFKFSDGAPFIGSQVTGPPVITGQPIDTTVALGGSATFTARAAGASPISYQWTFNGVSIPGATTSSYTKNNAQVSDAGNYSVIVSNTFSTATATAALTVGINPPVLYESFNYTNIGSAVSSNTPANWTSGGSLPNDLNVTSGNLNYPGLATSVGNSVTNGGAGLGIRRLLGTNINSGTVYVSALFAINNLGFGTWNGAATQVGALTATDNTSFRLQIVVKSNSPSGYVFGLQKGGTGSTAVFDTTEYHTNDTILLVGKYDFTASPNAATLWINPKSSTFSSPSAPTNGFVTVSSGTDGPTVDRFNIRQNTATSVPAAMQWDELRVGFSWAEVTPLAARFGSISFLPDGRLQLQALGLSGNPSIQLSSNLVDWFSLTNISSSNGAFQYFESITNAPKRFYRLNLAP